MKDKIVQESGLCGLTHVESPICRARSQICTQYMVGVRFIRARHLALVLDSKTLFRSQTKKKKKNPGKIHFRPFNATPKIKHLFFSS